MILNIKPCFCSYPELKKGINISILISEITNQLSDIKINDRTYFFNFTNYSISYNNTVIDYFYLNGNELCFNILDIDEQINIEFQNKKYQFSTLMYPFESVFKENKNSFTALEKALVQKININLFDFEQDLYQIDIGQEIDKECFGNQYTQLIYNNLEYVEIIRIDFHQNYLEGTGLFHNGLIYSLNGRDKFANRLIIPILHPSDVIKAKSHKKHNIEFWVPKFHWYDHAIDEINKIFDAPKIRTIGESIDDDIITVKGYQLGNLDPNKIYTLGLFDDPYSDAFEERLSWKFRVLNNERYKQIQFVERLWINTSPFVNQPIPNREKYGIGFTFPRISEESLFDRALLDTIFREADEFSKCFNCTNKTTCKTMLPFPFKTHQYQIPVTFQSDCVFKA